MAVPENGHTCCIVVRFVSIIRYQFLIVVNLLKIYIKVALESCVAEQIQGMT